MEDPEDIYRKAFKECEFKLKNLSRFKAEKPRSGLERLMRCYWENCDTLMCSAAPKKAWKVYDISLAIAKSVEYSAKDIGKFCSTLESEGCFVPGLFVSALANKIFEYGIRVAIKPKAKIDYLGYMQSKGKLIIKGNAGDSLGEKMEGGEIIVYGNAGNWIGAAMWEGSITISGNAGHSAANHMEGGEIMIKGNADWHTGFFMHGGKLIVSGRITGRSDAIYGGEVWESGKRVFP